jgi:hypothetical protein
VRKREGNRPDRRLIAQGTVSAQALFDLAKRLRYEGSGLHKLRPGDYGFVPSINPRPTKSVCDDLRSILLAEAKQLLRKGILSEMVSKFDPGGSPKYVWVVDSDGEVYEAKTKPSDVVYHGYRIGDDEPDMRRYILGEWRKRCPKA